MKLPVNCFKCDKEIEPAFKEASDKWSFQPSEATSFYSGGQYGSTVWDPMSNIHKLMINICDSCLIEFKSRVALVRTIKRIPTTSFHEWDPNTEVD